MWTQIILFHLYGIPEKIKPGKHISSCRGLGNLRERLTVKGQHEEILGGCKYSESNCGGGYPSLCIVKVCKTVLYNDQILLIVIFKILARTWRKNWNQVWGDEYNCITNESQNYPEGGGEERSRSKWVGKCFK